MCILRSSIRCRSHPHRCLFLSSFHSQTAKISYKVGREYGEVKDGKQKSILPSKSDQAAAQADVEDASDDEETSQQTPAKLGQTADSFDTILQNLPSKPETDVSDPIIPSSSTFLVSHTPSDVSSLTGLATDTIIKNRNARRPPPQWHAPYKLKRVIAGHQGWVRALAVDPTNEWFASGSNDRTIKLWDLASGVLKLTLTGHTAAVRALEVSTRHPYLFSGADDREARCWDLEHNQSIRTFHGHYGGISSIKVHPTLDLVVTGSKDRAIRVWDMRSRENIRELRGHQHHIGAIGVQATDPQVVSASYDGTVKLWDVINARCVKTLTHHKKSVRAMDISPTENSFASASTDSIRMWKLPEGTFMRKAKHEPEVINSLQIHRNGIMCAGSDVGSLHLYDYKTGHRYQTLSPPPQPGSLESEKGIFASVFDMSGSRIITGDADKSIKVYAEIDDATPATHPIVYDPHEQY
jgi:pleiotropic regulator 1